jgi:predicted metal-dependent hydrolase
MPDNWDITIIKSSRKTIALQIDPIGTLLVKAPFRTSDKKIEDFIRDHTEWIEKKLWELSRQSQNNRKENEYLFLGKIVTLQLGNYTSISVQDDKLLFPVGLLFRTEKELTKWYIHQAKEIITEQVEKCAQEMAADFKEITFSDTRSQWGRCTSDNRLQFSWRLVMAPLLVLNYVVVHELVHTKEKNHSQMFWMKVRNFNPSCKMQIKWLKENGHTLTIGN